MAKYTGTTELISGLIQANNQNFPLVDAGAIQVDDDGKRLNTILNEINESIKNIIASDVEINEEELNAMLTDVLV